MRRRGVDMDTARPSYWALVIVRLRSGTTPVPGRRPCLPGADSPTAVGEAQTVLRPFIAAARPFGGARIASAALLDTLRFASWPWLHHARGLAWRAPPLGPQPCPSHEAELSPIVQERALA